MPPFLCMRWNMIIRQLIDRVYMQVGDTLQVNYTPYQFLEFYNEGNQLLNSLIARYAPSMNMSTYTDIVKGRIELPEKAIGISRILANDKEIEGYHVLGLQTIIFDSDIEKSVTVEYTKSAGYAKLADESGYVPELESLLVDYMVTRAMNGDVTGIASNMASVCSALGSQTGSDDVVIAKGYWDYDRTRIDYSD